MASAPSKGGALGLSDGAVTMVANGKPSLNKFALLRLMTVERAMRQTRSVVEQTKAEIETKMKSGCVDSNEIATRMESKMLKNDMLREYRETLKDDISQCKELTVKLEKDCSEKSVRLGSLRGELEQKRNSLELQRQNYQERREMYLKINALLLVRRKQLINEISNIYPLEEIFEAKTERRQHSIFGFVVPNADDISTIKSADEEKVASGLGYTAHTLLMISQFLDMPLRFPIIHRGSRSGIHDHITKELLDRDRDFPLHSKGKEKFLFNYGVFLLNKNIAQLRHYCGLSTQDLRNTLPNLHSLLELRLGVQLGNKVPVRSGAGLHSLPSSTKQIVQANDLVGVFKDQKNFSKESNDCIKPIDDSRFQPVIPGSADSSSALSAVICGVDPNTEETCPTSEEDANGEREKWLLRNPTMASFIGDSNSRQVDSEGSFDQSGDESEENSRRNEDVEGTMRDRPHGSLANGNDVDEDDNDDVTPTMETPSGLVEIGPSISTNNGRDHFEQSVTVPTPDKLSSDSSVPLDENAPDDEPYANASDIPKGLRASSQSKVKTANQRPAGLSVVAHKGLPKGLSRGNARGASSTFHGGAGGRTPQSASKLIAETFAKHKSDTGPGNKKDRPTPEQTQKSAVLTNANFNLVDRSKRVISDD